MQKYAVVDSTKCTPLQCPVCTAAEACTHHLLEREEEDEAPVLWSVTACVGCGNCVKACPSDAIFIQHGSAVRS